VAGNFLEQIRRAQQAAKTKPENRGREAYQRDDLCQPRRRGEAYSELRAGGADSCVLRFLEFPDFVTGL
jgi:hypothetical protein